MPRTIRPFRTCLAALIVIGMGLGQEEPQVRPWLRSGPPEKSVDVLFVSDGYTKASASKFSRDVDRYASRLLEEPPFCWYRKKFNVSSVFAASKDGGCDSSPGEEKVSTVLESHFDAPAGRLLVFKDCVKLKDLVISGGGADIVFVIVNTEKYGGAGSVLDEITVRGRPLPAPTCSAQDTRSFLITIHELGHSFASLADEYEDVANAPTRPLPEDGDLEAANVTLPDHFDRSSSKKLAATLKWRHFLALPWAAKHEWLHEGGYYRRKGVFRPWRKCMMNILGDRFCPVCCEEVAKAIVAASGDEWNDAEFHNRHPLTDWR